VGHGAQLLLNLPPDRTGRIPEADARRAKEFGDEVRRRFSTPLSGAAGTGRKLVLDLGTTSRVDHVMLQERLDQGERVRAYHLDGLAWGKWRRIGEGKSIGHKRIQPVPPDGYTQLRLTVTDTAGEPVIRTFVAYNTGVTPPATWQQPVTLWADDTIGTWSGDTVELDLTDKLPAAAQYRIRFVPEGDADVSLHDLKLLMNGGAQPTLVREASGRHDILILTLPAVGYHVTLHVGIQGAERGKVLLRRIQ